MKIKNYEKLFLVTGAVAVVTTDSAREARSYGEIPEMMEFQEQSFRGQELAEQVVTAQDSEKVLVQEQPSLLQAEQKHIAGAHQEVMTHDLAL